MTTNKCSYHTQNKYHVNDTTTSPLLIIIITNEMSHSLQNK